MRILHCADIHLDSKLKGLERNKAKSRNAELLHTFLEMIDYANREKIDIVLIAGDWFDSFRVSATTRNAVMEKINAFPEIVFYYLKGNHDAENFLEDIAKLPANLQVFDRNWQTFRHGKVTISGVDLYGKVPDSIYAGLVLDSRDYNIVMLHGQETESGVSGRPEMIPLKNLRNRGIDYLALGHIHAYKSAGLDQRGSYCYPGCLEGRGFDECGEHGFVVLTIDEESLRMESKFVPFGKRRLYEVPVDISDCLMGGEILGRMQQALIETGATEEDLVKIVLCGEVDVACEKNLDYLLAGVKENYYFAKIEDKSALKVNAEDYVLDLSLKGEFVRLLLADETIDEEDKAAAIRFGLQAIAGEEIG